MEKEEKIIELIGVEKVFDGEQAACDAILGGDISASPYRLKAKKEQTACTYCEYRDVCGFDPDIEGYAYRDIGPEDDDVLEEKMAECTGKEDLLDAIHRGSEESD